MDYTVPNANADKAATFDITARVAGRVVLRLRLLNQQNQNDTKPPKNPLLSDEKREGIVTKAVHAELLARKIKLTEAQRKNLKLRQKVHMHMIRSDEFKNLRVTRDIKNEKEVSVSDIEPKSESDLMKAFLDEKQDELLEANRCYT